MSSYVSSSSAQLAQAVPAKTYTTPVTTKQQKAPTPTRKSSFSTSSTSATRSSSQPKSNTSSSSQQRTSPQVPKSSSSTSATSSSAAAAGTTITSRNQASSSSSRSTSSKTKPVTPTTTIKNLQKQQTTTKTTSVVAASVTSSASAAAASANTTTTTTQSPLGIEERAAKDVVLPPDPDLAIFKKLFSGCKLYYSSFPRDVILAAADELGMSRTNRPSNADLIYVEHNPLSTTELREVDGSYQRTNCFVGMKNLAHKDQTAMVINIARGICDECFPEIYDTFPETYILPTDKERLMKIAANSIASKSKKKKTTTATAKATTTTQSKNQQVSTRKKITASSSSTTTNNKKTSATAATATKSDDSDSSSDTSVDDDDSIASSELHRQYLQNAPKEKTFIVKPSDGGGGEGISLCSASELSNLKYNDCVVQEYENFPLLLDGFKFDLRIYVVVTSLLPLRYYVHREGLCRMATMKYEVPSKKNFHKLNMHLTNYSLNKYDTKNFVQNVNEDFDETSSKRSISTAFKQLEEEYSCEYFDQEEIWDKIGEITQTTMLSYIPFLLLGVDTLDTSTPGVEVPLPCFQIIGIDILIDSQFTPHLLEVNSHPSLFTDAAIDMLVKGLLARHVLRMVNHPFARSHRRRLKKTKNKNKKDNGKNRKEEEEEDPSSVSATATQQQQEDEDEDQNNNDNDEDEDDDENLPLHRANYQFGERENFSSDPVVPKSAAEWEVRTMGPIFQSFQPKIEDLPLYRYVTQPFLRLRDIFLIASTGGALKNNPNRVMNMSRWSKFARRYGLLSASAGASSSGAKFASHDYDLMFLKYTRSRGIRELGFSDFCWLLIQDLGAVLCPNPFTLPHDRLRSVVEFLESHETDLTAPTPPSTTPTTTTTTTKTTTAAAATTTGKK